MHGRAFRIAQLLVSFTLTGISASAQSPAPMPAQGLAPVPQQVPGPTTDWRSPEARETLVLAGLIQPVLLGGANLAFTHAVGRLTFSYSHGVSLSYNGLDFLRSSAERAQNLTVYSPWSTGGGVGYRMNRDHDVRIEFKAHRYRVSNPAGQEVRYTAFSLGPALYRVRRFRRLPLVLESSFRVWPNIATTLPGGRHRFTQEDGSLVTHRPHQLTAFVNFSVGWKH